jgi:hypothetical protein
MTDKKYYCQNGDLIEVGNIYANEDNEELEVVAIHHTDIVVFDGDEYLGYRADELVSLWQEQPGREGISE